MDAEMTITVRGTEMTLELLKRALVESPRTTICPESIFPGYSLVVVSASDIDKEPQPVVRGYWRHEDGTRCPSWPDSFNFTYTEEPWACIHGHLICHKEAI